MLRPLKFSVILSKLRLPKANRAPRRIHPYHRVAFPLILQTGLRMDASLKANPLNFPNSLDWLAQHDNPKQRNMLRPLKFSIILLEQSTCRTVIAMRMKLRVSATCKTASLQMTSFMRGGPGTDINWRIVTR